MVKVRVYGLIGGLTSCSVTYVMFNPRGVIAPLLMAVLSMIFKNSTKMPLLDLTDAAEVCTVHFSTLHSTCCFQRRWRTPLVARAPVIDQRVTTDWLTRVDHVWARRWHFVFDGQYSRNKDWQLQGGRGRWACGWHENISLCSDTFVL